MAMEARRVTYWVGGAQATRNAKRSSRSRGAGGIRGKDVLDRRELPDTLGCPGRALIVELILVHLTILGVSFGLLAFESREMAANFIGRKHTSHFGDKRGSSLAKAECSVAALAKFISFSLTA